MKFMSWSSPRSKRFWLWFTVYWLIYCGCLMLAANLNNRAALVGFSLGAGLGLCAIVAEERSR